MSTEIPPRWRQTFPPRSVGFGAGSADPSKHLRKAGGAQRLPAARRRPPLPAAGKERAAGVGQLQTQRQPKPRPCPALLQAAPPSRGRGAQSEERSPNPNGRLLAGATSLLACPSGARCTEPGRTPRSRRVQLPRTQGQSAGTLSFPGEGVSRFHVCSQWVSPAVLRPSHSVPFAARPSARSSIPGVTIGTTLPNFSLRGNVQTKHSLISLS